MQERRQSPTFIVRCLNNFAKAMLIGESLNDARVVVDLCGGKGGDLLKFCERWVEHVVVADHASKSVETAKERYDEHRSRRRDMKYSASFLAHDCFDPAVVGEIRARLPPQVATADLVSCQFAFHYAFSSESSVRNALKIVSDLLHPGGLFIGTTPDAEVIFRKLVDSTTSLSFGNSLYNIEFDRLGDSDAWKKRERGEGATGDYLHIDETSPFGLRYTFTLKDSVEAVPEYLVYFPALVKLAKEYGLILRLRTNLTQLVTESLNTPRGAALRRTVMRGVRGAIPEDAWDVAYLYCAFVFQRC